jgi:CheY-like chemotaxis protein
MRNVGFADLARLRVLVVDDDPGFHKVFKTILRGVGVSDVRMALNAGAAFREMCVARFDVVFVDWLMEPLDGLNFVRLLRRAKDSPDPLVPIIMLTGHAELHRVKEA